MCMCQPKEDERRPPLSIPCIHTLYTPSLPVDKPNHLLGIADEPSIWAGAALGVDTFDSCFPTRIARHGTLLTENGPVYIRKGAEHASWIGGCTDGLEAWMM